MMSFLQFVRPALYKAGGYQPVAWRLPQTTALLDSASENDGGRRNYMRCRLYYCEESGLRAEVFAQQGSHMVSSMIGANGIAIFEPGQKLAANDSVCVQIICPIT